jgi:hypothetical protein
MRLRVDPKQQAPTRGDIEVKHGVEFEIRSDGQFAWLMVDSVCAVRMICRDHAPILVNDQRHGVKQVH